MTTHSKPRDEMAEKLGSTRCWVGINWMRAYGFPTEAAAKEYVDYVKRVEKRDRVHSTREIQEVGPDTFTVHIHF
jgi:hypothetical protein